MAFKTNFAPNFFALNIAARALAVAGLGFAVLYLLATTQYYATAAILVGLMLLAIADMARLLARLDAPVTRIMEALSAKAHDYPLGSTEQFIPGGGAVGKTIALLQNERKEHVRQTGYLQSLADTVSTALIVIAADGHIQLANRAAQLLAGEEVGRLGDVAAIGAGAAADLLALQPGARRIVKLENGQQMLASMAHFSAPGRGDLRLLALQSIVGELDAVELKAWRDMTRVLAHEIMNSLTPISSLSESLSGILRRPEKASSTEVLESVDTITRRSQGLMNFVERYRKIADLPAPVLRPIALNEFAKSLDTLMAPAMTKKGIAYSSTVVPADLSVEADGELLTQAVINLLHNAVDAVGGRENPTVTLACSAAGGRVAIAVSDNGAGISPEKLEDIFVPFFTTKPGGAGIGLSLARQIALAHHGQIEVDANRPCGAVFRMVLPAG